MPMSGKAAASSALLQPPNTSQGVPRNAAPGLFARGIGGNPSCPSLSGSTGAGSTRTAPPAFVAMPVPLSPSTDASNGTPSRQRGSVWKFSAGLNTAQRALAPRSKTAARPARIFLATSNSERVCWPRLGLDPGVLAKVPAETHWRSHEQADDRHPDRPVAVPVAAEHPRSEAARHAGRAVPRTGCPCAFQRAVASSATIGGR